RLILAIAVVAGVCDALTWPVMTVFVKDLVGSQQLRVAVAVNSARFNLTRIVGPAVGGLLLAWFGSAACLAVAAAAIGGVGIALVFVRVPPQAPPETATPLLPALKDGL